MAGMDVDVVGFMGMFAGWSKIGSFLLMAYEVVGMRKEGDEAEYIPLLHLLLLVSGYCVQCQMRGGSWACVVTFAATRLVGGISEREWGGGHGYRQTMVVVVGDWL